MRAGTRCRRLAGDAQEQFAALQKAVAADASPDAARATTFLRNVLARVPAFSESLGACARRRSSSPSR